MRKSKTKVFILLGSFMIFGFLFIFSDIVNKNRVERGDENNQKSVSIEEKKSVKEKKLKTYHDADAISESHKKSKEISKKNARNYYRKLYESKKAYTKADISVMKNNQIKAMFYSTKITKKIFKRIYGKSYKKNCTVPKSDLRYIRVLHYGFDGNVHIGELITNKSISKNICKIFYKLFKSEYQIEKMLLIDEYDADDNLSMADNNTSCFNFRFVSGTERLSNHSYGLAIDINPLYNPYIHTMNNVTVCEPENGKKYQNRRKDFEHKIDSGDLCCKIFKKYGFTWGGDWENSKDYQHFQYKI